MNKLLFLRLLPAAGPLASYRFRPLNPLYGMPVPRGSRRSEAWRGAERRGEARSRERAAHANKSWLRYTRLEGGKQIGLIPRAPASLNTSFPNGGNSGDNVAFDFIEPHG